MLSPASTDDMQQIVYGICCVVGKGSSFFLANDLWKLFEVLFSRWKRNTYEEKNSYYLCVIRFDSLWKNPHDEFEVTGEKTYH